MPRVQINIIQYSDLADHYLVLNLGDEEDTLRAQIQDFVNTAHGEQLVRNSYWLRFKDANDRVGWISPSCSIERAFMYARRCLRGRAEVRLAIFQRSFKLEKDVKVEKSEGHFSDWEGCSN